MWSRGRHCCRCLPLWPPRGRHKSHISVPKYPPLDAPTFKQRMAVAPCSIKRQSPVDIGFKALTAKTSRVCRQEAPPPDGLVPLDLIDEENVLTQPELVRRLARHYGVYETMFGAADFMPVVPMRVEFAGEPSDEALTQPGWCHVVARGNVIKPAEAASTPAVTLRVRRTVAENSRWTLACSSLEGGTQHEQGENLLWMVDNISGGVHVTCDHIPAADVDVASGGDEYVDVVVSDGQGCVVNGREVLSYRQPLPLRGTGYHRVAFVLYKHTGEAECYDTSDIYTLTDDSSDIYTLTDDGSEAAFSSARFYGQRQHWLTPAGLCFYQTDWDGSVQRWLQHKSAAASEPVFQYEFRPHYVHRQAWFPAGESVQHFFDKQMDWCDIQQQMLIKRLQRVRPLLGDVPEYGFPMALVPDGKTQWMPSWKLREVRKEAMGIGKYYFIKRRLFQLFDPNC